ncbi:MAG: hypothetical protein AAF652_07940, partial [Cyanobacteria bacterium P01_C01_bin.72]
MNNKKIGTCFLVSLVLILGLSLILPISPAYADDEPLSAWKNSASKSKIMAFVKKVTDPDDRSHFVPVADRVAVFDNDGTLWAERPQYFQLDFLEANKEAQSQINLKKLPKDIRREIDADRDGK